MKKKLKISIILCIFVDLCMATFLFFSYGPVDYFRELLITTAMATKDHKYLARTIYDDATIAKVMSANYVVDVNEDTDISHITFEQIDEKDNYASKYEEEILKKEEGNDLYKVIPVSGNGFKGYLTVIYDPKRISLVTSNNFGKRGEFLNIMAKEHNAIVAINGSGFVDLDGRANGSTPTGRVIKDGKLIWTGVDTGWGGGLAGFNNDGVLVLTRDSADEAIRKGMKDAVEFGPFLIVNGKSAIMKGNGGFGVTPRTILAQRQDGIVLFLIIDGRKPGYSIGASLVDVTSLLEKYGAYNAVNLDGGASSSLNINGKIVNKPCAVSYSGERMIPNAWIVK